MDFAEGSLVSYNIDLKNNFKCLFMCSNPLMFLTKSRSKPQWLQPSPSENWPNKYGHTAVTAAAPRLHQQDALHKSFSTLMQGTKRKHQRLFHFHIMLKVLFTVCSWSPQCFIGHNGPGHRSSNSHWRCSLSVIYLSLHWFLSTLHSTAGTAN